MNTGMISIKRKPDLLERIKIRLTGKIWFREGDVITLEGFSGEKLNIIRDTLRGAGYELRVNMRNKATEFEILKAGIPACFNHGGIRGLKIVKTGEVG